MNYYEESFELILHAGNAKSTAMTAIEESRNFHFEKAEKLIEEANDYLRLAHQSQTNLIRQEASGVGKEVSIILVHAQDHLTSAMMAIDNAFEFLNIYRILYQLMKEEK